MHKATQWVIGFVRVTSRHKSRAEQERRLKEAGAVRIYDDVSKLLKAVRKGANDTVVVTYVYLFADPAHARKRGGLRASMRTVLDGLRKTGTTVFDLDSCTRATTAEDYIKLERHGTDALARSNASGEKPGRRRTPIPAEKMSAVEAMWRNVVKYRTNDAATLAINALDGVRISKQALERRFGNSGRKPKRK